MNYKINTKKRTVAVLGLGITGKSIIDYFKNSEIELICWDDDLIKRKQLINQKIRLHNLSDPEIWADIDTLLISPGIPYLYPKAHPAVINALENSVRIDNDIGLFFKNMINKNKKPLTICVTGSNGKSTTTSLINHILNSISNNSELGGNIGRPVLELNNNKSIKFNVLELSSYQIEIANFLSPDIAIFLNLSSDHLERHGGIGGYFNAKARLFYYGLPKFSIINIDQPEGRYLANILEKNSNMNTQVICLSSNKTNTNSKWSISLEDDFIVERKDGLETFRYNIHQYVNLPGEHNLMNSCIAFITCKLLQIDSTQILNNMINFKGLPHRAELVRKINEVSFIISLIEHSLRSSHTNFESIAFGQGATMALPIWGSYMKQIYADSTISVSSGPFEAPIDVSIPIDCDSLSIELKKKSFFEKDGLNELGL